MRDKAVEVDVLVNNAGLLFEGDFAATALEDHLRLLQVNIVALTALTRLFLDSMLERKSGRILNVASTGAFVPIPSLAVYAASKAYALSLTEALSEELKGDGRHRDGLVPRLHHHGDGGAIEARPADSVPRRHGREIGREGRLRRLSRRQGRCRSPGS